MCEEGWSSKQRDQCLDVSGSQVVAGGFERSGRIWYMAQKQSQENVLIRDRKERKVSRMNLICRNKFEYIPFTKMGKTWEKQVLLGERSRK